MFVQQNDVQEGQVGKDGLVQLQRELLQVLDDPGQPG